MIVGGTKFNVLIKVGDTRAMKMIMLRWLAPWKHRK